METYLQQSDILNATLVGLGRGTGGQGSAKDEVLLPPLALGFIVLFLWKFGWLELQLSQRREVILRHFGEKINLSGRFYGQAGRHCFWTLPAW